MSTEQTFRDSFQPDGNPRAPWTEARSEDPDQQHDDTWQEDVDIHEDIRWGD